MGLHCGKDSEALRLRLGWGWASGWFRAEGVAASLEMSEEAPGDYGGGGSRSRGRIRRGEELRDILRGRPLAPPGPREAPRGAGRAPR